MQEEVRAQRFEQCGEDGGRRLAELVFFEAVDPELILGPRMLFPRQREEACREARSLFFAVSAQVPFFRKYDPPEHKEPDPGDVHGGLKERVTSRVFDE